MNVADLTTSVQQLAAPSGRRTRLNGFDKQFKVSSYGSPSQTPEVLRVQYTITAFAVQHVTDRKHSFEAVFWIRTEPALAHWRPCCSQWCIAKNIGGYWVICARNEAPKRRAASAEGAEGVEFLGRGASLPSRLGSLGERRELPQRGPGRSPGRQRILGIFEASEAF